MKRVALYVMCSAHFGCGSGTPPPNDTPPLASSAPVVASASASVDVPAPVAEAPKEAPPPALPDATFTEVEPTAPPAKLPSVAFRSPPKDQVVPAAKAGDFEVKLDAKNWSDDGGDLCVALDQRPCVRVTDPKKSLKLSELAGEDGLKSGQHVLVVYPRLHSHEVVRGTAKSATGAVLGFFVGDKSNATWKQGGPALSFSAPTPSANGDVLIDWYVQNATLADGQYVLHASVTGPGLGGGKGEVITSWKPWLLAHTQPGTYTIRLVLLHFEPSKMESASATTVRYSAHEVGGVLAEATRTVRVEAKE